MSLRNYLLHRKDKDNGRYLLFKSSVPFKSLLTQWTKAPAVSGILEDKIGKDERDASSGAYLDGDGTRELRLTGYATTAFTYIDHTTGLEVADTTDASADFLVPSNGMDSVTVDGYTGYFEGGNQDTVVELINSNGDVLKATIQNATNSDRVSDVTVYSEMDMTGYTEQLLYEVYPIPVTAGLFDFSAKNLPSRKWWFEDGTTSEDERPAVTLATDQTVYLTGDFRNSVNLEISDNGTNNLYVGDLGDLPLLTNYANFYGCLNLTGDISSLSNITNYANFGNCVNLTGDISSLSNVTNFASFNSCSNLTGILDPHANLQYLYLTNTGLSINDVDQTVINLDTNTTRTNGTLNLSGLQRSSASTTAINSLIALGWSVTDATVV